MYDSGACKIPETVATNIVTKQKYSNLTYLVPVIKH